MKVTNYCNQNTSFGTETEHGKSHWNGIEAEWSSGLTQLTMKNFLASIFKHFPLLSADEN